jgi:dUTP pyrophosphatase
MALLCKRTADALDLPLPARHSEKAAGMDLYANIHTTITLKPGARVLIPTGIVLALPDGYEAQVRPRSGLALKHGITILNAPGTVDADYRGEVGALLINLGDEDYTLQRGERVAQLVIARITQENLTEVQALPESTRGTGGYGSTGAK